MIEYAPRHHGTENGVDGPASASFVPESISIRYMYM